jgi:type I restriction enzyme R subunit
MSRNEAQVRFELIDPALEARGWQRTDIRVEEIAAQIDIIYGKGQRRPKGRSDYVLRKPLSPDSEPIPLAILEAKHEGHPPERGLQQGKGYRVGQLQHVPFVFSSNGHLFVEYDENSAATSEAKPMSEFPTPEELIQRYCQLRGLTMAAKEVRALETPYKQGRDYLRYYQDASIRAAIETVALHRMAERASKGSSVPGYRFWKNPHCRSTPSPPVRCRLDGQSVVPLRPA